MPESDRPRRPVPAWQTAPPVDEVAPERVAAAGHANASGREARPTPASSRAAHAAPVRPTTVARVGPIGSRTPRRFAHQQAAARSAAPAPAQVLAPAPTRSFDTVLHAAVSPADATMVVAAPTPVPQRGGGGDAGLPTELLDQPVPTAAAPEPRRALGATAGAGLGAVAGIATIGLAAWWFSAPSTVHGVGVVLGLLALVVSIVALRDRTSTWQRPVALLGAVLGGVGTVVLLWAVAAALLPLAGVTLPDVTGTGVTPTLAP
ncbi:hypothetical protein [Curtobacterium poinsettiae]|nr:hypothetical protein [Curtobacterium flaccumfaciens]UXN13609.1 hypothetical protein N8D76_09085 [Curtobacterium flaccumfaciens pv. poinsettiae]